MSRPSSRLSCENGMEKMGKDVVRMIMIMEMTMIMMVMVMVMDDQDDEKSNIRTSQ